MMIEKDNFMVKQSNPYLRWCIYSTQGDRDDQQDSAGYLIGDKASLVVICDGMGGHRGGKLASSIGIKSMISAFEGEEEKENVQDLFLQTVKEIDQTISDLKDEEDKPLQAGTTMVSVYICERTISWVSVGDSRLYLVRGEEMVQITKDHTYALALRENQEAGLISDSFYAQQYSSADALISFLGVDGLPVIDSNVEPFALRSGDRLLLMSDGLYKYVSDESMHRILARCKDADEAVRAMDCEAERGAEKKRILRDNMTVAIIEII